MSVRDATGNLRPGHLTKSTVTLMNYDNFYLQSHAAIVGTATPTHYILYNSHGTPIRGIQKMTFNLHYLYGRPASSVGLVPTAYYTDKVCDRARCYFRRAYVPFRRGDFDAEGYSLQTHAHVKDHIVFI
jgi:eukaryotic translation initiation factor 2C